MNASYEWLKDFVPIELTPNELRDLITARCATVDEVVQLRADLKDIVVGRVVEAKPHPNSDHLNLTKVDAGTGELLDVVCGAPNVTVGTLYPFAPVGATLPGGLKIEKRKIRGEPSNGMLCSARELGLSEEHVGIMALDIDVAPGTPFMQAVPVGDTQIVIDVLPNRPDLLSHEGLAREIAAATGTQVALPEIPGGEFIGNVRTDAWTVGGIWGGSSKVLVEDEDGCLRYMGAKLYNVKVGPSPEWLKKRVESVGGRSINNIVDVTNYMLHGFGQPMHAFDVDKLQGKVAEDNTIKVRRARSGETITTLDGIERKLTDDMTVIADLMSAQAIAGVMGSGESGVTEDTKNIFLEVASFNPSRIRATRKALNLSTDASYRYERGVDPESLPRLLNYAVKMILVVAGGKIDEKVSDVYPNPVPVTSLDLRLSRVSKLLGETVGEDECRELLESVGFGVSRSSRSAPLGIPFTPHNLHSASSLPVLNVSVPSWRRDVTREVDLIEEIARLRGYDTFSSEIRGFRPGTVPDSPAHVVSKRVREALVSAGLFETRAMPFVKDAAIRVANPLAENEAFLRDNLLDTLSRRAEYNLAHMQGNVRIFEIGTAFYPSDNPNDPPREELHAAALIMGDRNPSHFTNPKPPKIDDWDAKWIAELIAKAAYPSSQITLDSNSDGWNVKVDGIKVGSVGKVKLDAPVWADVAYGIEIDVKAEGSNALFSIATSVKSQKRALEPSAGVRYKPLPTTPAVEFDLALLVPTSMEAQKVEATIRESSGELLESVQLFDEFQGKGVPEGTRSLAWRLTFRHPERTLRDKEIEGRREKLLRTLEGELGVRQRTS